MSDRTHGTNVAAESPVVATKQLLPPPPPTTAIPPATATTKSSGGRSKRGGARKTQQHAQDTMSVDGDEGEQGTKCSCDDVTHVIFPWVKRPTQRGDKAREVGLLLMSACAWLLTSVAQRKTMHPAASHQMASTATHPTHTNPAQQQHARTTIPTPTLSPSSRSSPHGTSPTTSVI